MLKYKGVIKVSNNEGDGTTFSIYLPFVEGNVESHHVNKIVPINVNANILVIDDEKIVCEIVTEILSDQKYRVTSYLDSTKAIDYYKKSWKEIDLVILDMMMPKLGGQETFLELRKVNPSLLKVILTSGYSVNEQIQKLLDQGGVDFLIKPFDHDKLIEIVGQMLK